MESVGQHRSVFSRQADNPERGVGWLAMNEPLPRGWAGLGLLDSLVGVGGGGGEGWRTLDRRTAAMRTVGAGWEGGGGRGRHPHRQGPW